MGKLRSIINQSLFVSVLLFLVRLLRNKISFYSPNTEPFSEFTSAYGRMRRTYYGEAWVSKPRCFQAFARVFSTYLDGRRPQVTGILPAVLGILSIIQYSFVVVECRLSCTLIYLVLECGAVFSLESNQSVVKKSKIIENIVNIIFQFQNPVIKTCGVSFSRMGWTYQSTQFWWRFFFLFWCKQHSIAILSWPQLVRFFM